MTVYEAIEEMRIISRQPKGEFSFSFMSCSESKGKSDGFVSVERARLRARPNTEQNSVAEMMEAYINLDTGEALQFYQPLLMLFNGKKVDLT